MPIDTNVLLTFFLLIAFLLVKVFYHKSINSVEEYREFYSQSDKSLLGVSATMSLLGASALIISIKKTYELGLIFIIFSTAYVIANIISARFLVIKLCQIPRNSLTVSDLFNLYYGKVGEYFCSLFAIIYDICMICCQKFVLIELLTQTTSLNFYRANILVSAYFFFFSCLTSFRISLLIDLIKCIFILTFFPILSSISVYKAGGLLNLIGNLPENTFQVFNHQEFFKYALLFIFLILPFHTFQPVNIQRMLLINDAEISKKSHYLYGLLRSIFIWSTSALALSYLSLNSNANQFDPLSNIITTQLPLFLIDITLFSIFVFIIIKTDSHLNSIGLITTKNIFFTNSKRIFNEKLICSLSMCLANVISFFAIDNSHNGLMLTIQSQVLLAVSIGIPLIFALFKINISKRGIVIYYVVTTIIMILSQISEYAKFSELIIFLSCATIFIFIFKIENRNFNYIFDKARTFDKNKKIFNKKIFNLLRSSFNIKNLIAYSANKVELYGADYFAFGIYFTVNFSIPYYIWENEAKASDLDIIMRIISAILCATLMLKNFWPKRFNDIFPLFWHFTLTFNLPTLNFSMLILHHWSALWLINFTLSTLLLMFLTDWMSFVILTTIGVISAFAIHLIFIGYIINPLNYEIQYLAFYIFIYIILIGYIFLRRKEKNFSTKLEVTQILGGIIAHEIRTFLLIIKNYCSGLERYLPAIIDGCNSAYEHQLIQNRIDKKIFDVIKNSLGSIEKTTKKSFSFVDLFLINIKGPSYNKYCKLSATECLKEALNDYPLFYPERDYLFANFKNEFLFEGNKEMFNHIIYNLLNNSIYFVLNKKLPRIFIWLENGENNNFICVRDNGPGIDKKDIQNIFKRFFSKNKKGTGLGLSYCKLAMSAMGGEIICHSVKGVYTEFKLKFPKIGDKNET